MSWIGWAILIAIGLTAFVIFVLKKGIDETEEKKPESYKSETSVDFENMGSYIGGHPNIENPISNTVFRKNSDCCLFFYKDRSYSMPEFKFKIKVKSFKNISVEDFHSIEKKLSSGTISLTSAASSAIMKKKNKQTAFLTINWKDGLSDHSTVFSFEGKDSMKKANIAKDSFLRALN